jgi:RNA polymerase sigma-70 factor (ECF subfamily)
MGPMTGREPGGRREPRREEPRAAGVSVLPFVGSDEQLAHALYGEHPGAAKALSDRYTELIDRLLTRLLGAGDEVPPLIHQVLLRALRQAGRADHHGGLRGWLARVVVATARRHLRRRARARRLRALVDFRFGLGFGLGRLFPPARAGRPLPEAPEAGPARAMRATYSILEDLPVDQRIVFALRIVDAMPLDEVAAACRVPLGVARWRLHRAEARFMAAARAHPDLREWSTGAATWTLPDHS